MKKVAENWLFSVVGVIALLVILIALNLLGNFSKFRWDLTENHLYTLSQGSQRIVQKLDTPVEIRFYYSKDNASTPVYLRTYAQEVEDLLSEFQQASRGKIKIVKLDPKPDSDAEDSARLDGVEGQTVNLSDKVYLGLAVSCLDAKTAIPFLSPGRESLLEYDVSRAISSVANPKKAVIGVMSALPVLGRNNPMMMQRRQQGSAPWVFAQELKENYTVREVSLTADKIDDDISVLLVCYPKGITDSAQYAIDQFLLRGGKMVALLDPFSFVDFQMSGQAGMMGGEVFSASLDKLLKAWGINFTSNQVVADPAFATKIQREANIVQSDPSVLSLTADAINRSDPLGAATNDVLLPFAGAFLGTPADGLKEEVLISSSEQSSLIDAMTVQMGSDAVRKALKPAHTRYPLAVRVTGKFKTAFANGKPAAPPAEPTNPNATPTPTPSTSSTPVPLKEAANEGVVVLIGDADFAFDTIAGNEQQVLTQTVFSPTNGNLNFIESSVEMLAGDSNLMSIRSRASANRPFLVVNQMEAAAEQHYQSKIDELENSIAQTKQKLAALQNSNPSDQKTVLSPQQQAEIKKFQENEAKLDKELKQVRKDLRQEIDSLQNTLKWINIAAMPLLVTLAGLGFAIFKRQSRAAR
ncbi:MAG TPA: Gldg family protein [Chthoniobacterales bacterium]|nr:Gldg family protein [Chthoniobacterales bacterium]